MATRKNTAPRTERSPVRFRATGPKISGRDVSTAEHLLVPGAGRLPADYRAFLQKHNGATPEPATFDWKHPKRGVQIMWVGDFLGLDTHALFKVHQPDLISQTLLHRHDIPAAFVPIGYTGGDDILLLGVDESQKSYGQVWIKCMDEPGVERIGAKPELGMFLLARSFKEFVGALRPGEDEA